MNEQRDPDGPLGPVEEEKQRFLSGADRDCGTRPRQTPDLANVCSHLRRLRAQYLVPRGRRLARSISARSSCAILGTWAMPVPRPSRACARARTRTTSTLPRESMAVAEVLRRVDDVREHGPPCAGRAGGDPGTRSSTPSRRSGTRGRARRRRARARRGGAAARGDQPLPAGGRGCEGGGGACGAARGSRLPPTRRPRWHACARRLEALVGEEAALQAEGEGLAVEAREVARGGRRACRASPSPGRRCPGRRSTRSRSGGHGRTRRSSSSAAASRASGSGSCWRRTRWRRRRSASRRAARASRSCGGGSRRRWPALATTLDAGSSRRPLREASGRSAAGRASRRCGTRRAGGSRAARCSRRRGRGRAGRASARAPCRRRGRAAGRARRPPGARSTPSRPRCGRRAGGSPRGRAP